MALVEGTHVNILHNGHNEGKFMPIEDLPREQKPSVIKRPGRNAKRRVKSAASV